jgi:sugar phosphate isomerase/epimerase
VDRRNFLKTAGLTLPAVSAAAVTSTPMGYNTYCLRALRWTDLQHLDYAASLKLDGLFLQDSLDPQSQNPAHWAAVKAWAAERGLHLESGGGGILPKSEDGVPASIETLRKNIARAKGLGSPLVRCVIASERTALPPGPAEQHLQTALRILRAVKPQVQEAGLKLAIEVHKDFQAWEFQQLIEEVKDFTGIYLDTGNPVFVMEDPMQTVETLGKYALTFHLRDSVVYEHRRGVAVQWVPLGEGTVDFKAIIAKAKQVCPPLHFYIKPITGRPPAILPIYDQEFWKLYPRAKAADLARFLRLARSGQPYEGHVVIEDLQGRAMPPHFADAIKFQQKEHMERSIAYARRELALGVRS